MRKSMALVAVLLAGCGGGQPDDGPLISAQTYHDVVGVGDFAQTSDEDLDNIGRSLCSDMENLDSDEDRRAVWLAVNEQAESELQSLGMVLAMTARYCPQYFHLWDPEVEDIMGGELPW